MKKFALMMSIIFMLLTFAGAAYVLYNHGTVSAGYAVVPMGICFVWTGIYSGKNKRKKIKSDKY